jgi:hypothetical protein
VHLQARFGAAEPRACRLTSQHRSSQRYSRRLAGEEVLLRERLRLLARRHPRYGYRRIRFKTPAATTSTATMAAALK